MPKRELRWFETKDLIGWGCVACGWAHPVPRLIPSDKTPSEEAKAAFDKHKCEDNPPNPKRGDVNQAAARKG